MEVPPLKRRIKPLEFFTSYIPQFFSCLQLDGFLESGSIEVEVEEQGVFFISSNSSGKLTVTQASSDQNKSIVIIVDLPTFNICMQIFQRWIRVREKQQDIDTVQKWLLEMQSYSSRYADDEFFKNNPALCELMLIDDCDEEHCVSIELGRPTDQDPFFRIIYHIEDIPFNPHTFSHGALQAIVQNKAVIEGHVSYLSKLFTWLLPK